LADSVLVVTCPTHEGHAPSVEVQCGVPIPAFDRIERMDSILSALSRDRSLQLLEPRQFGPAPVARVHDEGLISCLATAWEASAGIRPVRADQAFADTFCHEGLREGLGPLRADAGHVSRELGRYCFDTITGVGGRTFDAAAGAVNTILTAAELVRQSDAATAPCAVALCRPPGHHVTRRVFGGGCFFNNVGIAAQWLVDHGAARIAVLDLDFHHGNGTQSLFYDRPDVTYVSIHGDPRRCYPYFTGYPEEQGSGPGRGHNVNIPLPAGIERERYLASLGQALDAVDRSRPEFLLISLGFDTFAGDPAGDARLRTEDYRAIAAAVGELSLPVVAALEGGYCVPELGDNLSSWIEGIRL
jgi:acetoin utilization deacetylase AcuC-like enzyme